MLLRAQAGKAIPPSTFLRGATQFQACVFSFERGSGPVPLIVTSSSGHIILFIFDGENVILWGLVTAGEDTSASRLLYIFKDFGGDGALVDSDADCFRSDDQLGRKQAHVEQAHHVDGVHGVLSRVACERRSWIGLFHDVESAEDEGTDFHQAEQRREDAQVEGHVPAHK